MELEIPVDRESDGEAGTVTSYEVVWGSKMETQPTVLSFRSRTKAKQVAKAQREAGFRTKLYAVVKLELDF